MTPTARLAADGVQRLCIEFAQKVPRNELTPRGQHTPPVGRPDLELAVDQPHTPRRPHPCVSEHQGPHRTRQIPTIRDRGLRRVTRMRIQPAQIQPSVHQTTRRLGWRRQLRRLPERHGVAHPYGPSSNSARFATGGVERNVQNGSARPADAHAPHRTRNTPSDSRARYPTTDIA